MRLITLAALAFAVAATPVYAAAPSDTVILSPAAEQKFHFTYGLRESDQLAAYIDTSISRALAARGVHGALRIETTIISATPDHPTFKQTGDNTSLDLLRSVSRGGAELSAKLINPQGDVVAEVHYTWTEPDLFFSRAAGTWTGAEQAIRFFADRVAAAYAAHA